MNKRCSSAVHRPIFSMFPEVVFNVEIVFDPDDTALPPVGCGGGSVLVRDDDDCCCCAADDWDGGGATGGWDGCC